MRRGAQYVSVKKDINETWRGTALTVPHGDAFRPFPTVIRSDLPTTRTAGSCTHSSPCYNNTWYLRVPRSDSSWRPRITRCTFPSSSTASCYFSRRVFLCVSFSFSQLSINSIYNMFRALFLLAVKYRTGAQTGT